MKVFVVGSSIGYSRFLKDVSLVSQLEEAEVVLFTGGEDVSPSIYHCKKHPSTYANLKRDKFEIAAFKRVQPQQLCVGICRGAQLLCCLNGGILIQNCTNHSLCSTHSINNGKIQYEIMSIHHQMMYPFNLPKEDYDILFTSPRRSSYYEGDKVDEDVVVAYGEPEIVLYHKKGMPKCLGVQGHPEMMPNSPVSEMINNLVEQLIHGDK